MLDLLLDIIFPRQCVGCGRWGKFICDRCAEGKIAYFPEQVCPYCELPSAYGYSHPRCAKTLGIDGMFALAHYQGIIPKIIHEIKYGGAWAITDELASLTAVKYHGQFAFQYMVPIPLSTKRHRERGFNQAEKLAKQLQFQFKLQEKEIEVANVLERNRDTRPQFDLKYEERKKNIQDAFSLSSSLRTRDLAGFSFCLVDDVATTGATIFEGARVLKKAGAEKVWGICIARGG